MAAVNAPPAGVRRIEIGVPFLGSVNVWLLEGNPLTLVDAGPANAESLAALEAALQGTATTSPTSSSSCSRTTTSTTPVSRRRSSSAPERASRRPPARRAWGIGYHERARLERTSDAGSSQRTARPSRRSTRPSPSATTSSSNSADFATTDILAHGGLVDAGGRRLRVVERPGTASPTRFSSTSTGRRARRRPPAAGDHLGSRGRAHRAVGRPCAAARSSTTWPACGRRWRWSSTSCFRATAPSSPITAP